MQRFHSAGSCRRAAVFRGSVTVLLAVVVYSAAAENPRKTGRREKGKKKNQAALSASVSPGGTEQSLTNIPLPIGHEAKGLTLPDFDPEGRLRGKFTAGSARR